MMTTEELTRYRMEFRFLGDFDLTESIAFTSLEDSWQDGDMISITPMMYLALLHEGIAFVKSRGLFRGDSNRPVGRSKLRLFALIMNIFGFNTSWFIRYLNELPDRAVSLPLQSWCNANFAVGPPPPVGGSRVVSVRPMISPMPSPPPSPPTANPPSPTTVTTTTSMTAFTTTFN
jgi:hypothetical protein